MGQRIYKDKKGMWRWRVVGKNNRILGDSGQGYHNRKDAVNGLLLLIENVNQAELRDIVAKEETLT